LKALKVMFLVHVSGIFEHCAQCYYTRWLWSPNVC